MRTRWLWLCLAASLALNVFFVGGVAYKRMSGDEVADDWRRPAVDLNAELDLSEAQQAGLAALREQAMARREAMRGSWQEGRKALLAELAKPELDRARLSALMADGMTRRSGAFEAMLVDLHAYLQTLSPEQRTRLLTLAEDRSLFRSLFGGRSRQSAQR